MALRIQRCSLFQKTLKQYFLRFCTNIQEKNLIKNEKLKWVSGLEKSDFISELKDPDSSLFTPALPVQSFSFAPYVNYSETLQNLVKLGVDLHRVEEDTEVASFLVKADFKRDVQPLILFLHHNSVPANQLGGILSKNPLLFKEPLEKLQLRIDYLISKSFSNDAIARIISGAPLILTTSTILTDRQLGFLQLKLKLSGDEVRSSVTKYPKIMIWDSDLIEENHLSLNKTLGFEEVEIKQLYLQEPKLLVAGKYAVAQRFDYLHNTMSLSHEALLRCPRALLTRLCTLQHRHSFLRFLDRVQFNPNLPNYTPLLSLCTLNIDEFCKTLARSSPALFNDYLKTL